MASYIKSRIFKFAKWFGGAFFLLFLLRFLYGFVATDSNLYNSNYSDFFGKIDNVRKNYASENFKLKSPSDIKQRSDFAQSQKYEKTASIKSKTSEFEGDEKLLKNQVKSFTAVIQYEQNIGQKGNRELHLLIGVNPILFDSFYLEIKKIGVLKAIDVTKVDKTNEYRQLNAKKTSLEKSLASLVELKSKNGQISDFVTLNDQILEVETKLQELGVELGNFNADNEFCTVKFSLYEGAAEKSISVFHRIKVAFEWSVKYYAAMVFSFLCVLLVSFFLLLIIDKLKILKFFSNKMEE